MVSIPEPEKFSTLNAGGEPAGEAFRCLLQVQLDHFGGARPDQVEPADIGAAGQQAFDLAVEFGLRIGHAGEIGLFQDCGAEPRLGEDHHPGRALQQVRTCPRADDQKERVLHLSMQPDDRGQTAKHFALSAFLKERHVPAAVRGVKHIVHAATSAVSRARRSFSRNCPALMT